MSVQDRIKKYRLEGGASDLVRVEVLVPVSGRDDVVELAASLRSDHRNRKAELSSMVDQAIEMYGIRILDNIDLDRVRDPIKRASVIARALIDRGDAQAFVLGRKIMAIAGS